MIQIIKKYIIKLLNCTVGTRHCHVPVKSFCTVGTRYCHVPVMTLRRNKALPCSCQINVPDYNDFSAQFGQENRRNKALPCSCHQDNRRKALPCSCQINVPDYNDFSPKFKEEHGSAMFLRNAMFLRSVLFLCCLSVLFLFAAPIKVYGATEFVSVIDTGGTFDAGGTGDFDNLSEWELTIQSDISATTTTKVFSYSAASGTIPNLATVVGEISGAIATSTFVTSTTTTSQILLTNIVGTFQSGETVYIEGMATSSYYVVISDAGDSAIAVAKCRATQGGADTTAVTIDGWTTSATNYIKVWTDPSENYRHQGKWDEGKYRLEVTESVSGYRSALAVIEEYVKIDGLQIKKGPIISYSGNDCITLNQSLGEIQISNNILNVTNNSTYDSYGIEDYYNIEIATVYKIWNNIIYGAIDIDNNAGGSIRIVNLGGSTGVAYVYNNTFNNSYIGIERVGLTVIAKNNLAQNCTDGYNGTFNASSDYNISDLANDAPSPSYRTNLATEVHFADEANDDFHLDSADTAARNAGTILYDSGDDANLNFTTDVDNNARLDSAGTWDIGADEVITKVYRSVGPSATTAIATGTTYGNVEIKPAYLAGSTTTITDYVASFWSDLPTNVGVGDALQYDDDDDGDIDASDSIVFITKRIDASHFSVRTASGAAPASTLAPDSNWSIFRAYTSLFNAEAGTENTGIDADLVNFDTWANGKNIATSQEQWNMVCYAGQGGAADTGAETEINGWTTSADSYIKVYTPTREDEVGITQRHNGKWDATKYVYDIATNFAIDVKDQHVKIDGLQFDSRDTINASIELQNAYDAGINTFLYVSNNIMWGNAGTYSSGLYLGESDLDYGYVYNNIIYDFTGASGQGLMVVYSSADTKTYIYNNTVFNSRRGFHQNISTGTSIFKNNIAQDCVDGFYDETAYGWGTSDYNLSDLAADAPGANSRNSTTVTFADEANDDFRLAPGDSGAHNFGTDLSNDPYIPFNTDITSTCLRKDKQSRVANGGDDLCYTRPRGASWDIGAHELITKIYRSVAPDADGSMAAIDDDNSQADTLTIATSGTATFEVAVADIVGVGDALVWDDDDDNDLDASDTILFIHGRTDSTHYTVRTESGALPTVGTTDNDKWAIYRAYTSLSLAEAGTKNTAIPISFTGGNRDIATNSEQWNIACYANGTEADTTAVNMDGWTTAAQNYLKIYTPYLTSEVGTSQRHSGKWDDNKYKLQWTSTANNQHIIDVRDDYWRMEGIQLEKIGGAFTGGVNIYVYPGYISLNSEIYIANNILTGDNTQGQGILFGDADANGYILNNIVYDVTSLSGGDGVSVNNMRAKIYNNTVYGCYRGIYTGSNAANLSLKNNISFNNTDYDYGGGAFLPETTNNLSEDATAPAYGTYYRNATVSFVDETNDDFHLSPSDTGARNFGVDLSQDYWLPITNDVDGQNKFSIFNFQFSNPDIGADESATPIYRSIAPSKTDALATGTGNNLTISGTTATFASTVEGTNAIGVGDAIQYDSDGNDSIDAIAFISARSSSTSFTVQSRDGGNPVATVADQNWSIFRAYTTLDNAEGGAENITNIDDDVDDFDISVSRNDGKDIYASNEQWNIAAYANGTTADTVGVDIWSWTTAPQNYIKIYTPVSVSEVGTSQRHQGRWSDSAYKMSITVAGSDGTNGLVNREHYVRVDGLQIEYNFNSTSVYGYALRLTTGEINSLDVEIYASNNIIKGNVTSGVAKGIVVVDSLPSAKIYNNIIYGFDSDSGSYYGTGIDVDGDRTYVYNNTVLDCSIGIKDDDGAPVFKNNIVQNCVNGYYGGFDAGSDYNISDVDQTDADSANATFNGYKTVQFADEANSDFHLASTDTSARNAGADLSADANIAITTDIDGHTRSTTTHSGAFDIGADESATPIYFSVGQNTDSHETGAGTVAIASGIATFSVAQTATNMGVGDAVVAGGNTYYITGKTSTLIWTVKTATGTIPADIAATDVTSVSHAFASLSLAEAGAGGASYLNTSDLWANNFQLNIPCYYDSGPDTTAVTIDGYTTGVPNYIKIYTPYDTTREVNASQRHGGKWDDAKYQLALENTTIITLNDSNVKMDGLQLSLSGTTEFRRGIYSNDVISNIDISNSIIENTGVVDNRSGIRTDSTSNTDIKIWNNIIYGFNGGSDSSGMIISSSNNNSYVYSNTVYNSYVGIESGYNDVIAKNNITQNCTDGYEGTFDASSDYNISDLASDAPSPSYRTNLATEVSFIDETNSDFHLAPTDTSAMDAGTSSVSEIADTAYDIDNHLRTQYDIGADEGSQEFVGMVMQTGGTGDEYSTLATWETGMQTDLVASSTRVFTISEKIGTVADNASVTGSSSGATADIVHVSTTTMQVLLENISGTFETGEQVQVDASNYIVISDLGNPAIAVARIDGAWASADTNAVSVDGWTTGANNYVKIYTTDAARHNGVWSEGKYRLTPSDGHGFDVQESYIVINGLQLAPAVPWGATRYGINFGSIPSNSEVTVYGNIIKSGNSFVEDDHGINLGYQFGLTNAVVNIANNIIYGFSATGGIGISVSEGDFTVNVNNNTFVNNDSGIIQTSGSVIAKNNVVQNSNIAYSGTFDVTSDYNISDDATNSGGEHDISGSVVQFADSSNSDFHLSSSDTAAKNAGTSTTGSFGFAQDDSGLYYDIDGTARGAAFDIGADEVPVEFVSTICENTSAGGDCADMDYSTLGGTSGWEDKVETDLTASSTRVFGGAITGSLVENDTVVLYSGATAIATGTVVATTSDQILIDSIYSDDYAETGCLYRHPISLVCNAAMSGDTWQKDGSNYWTVTGTLDDLGASPIAVAKIDGAWVGAETNNPTLEGWSTDYDNYIKIYTTNISRHTGKWNDDKFRFKLVPNSNFQARFLIREDYVDLDGLQFELDNSALNYSYPRTIMVNNIGDFVRIKIHNNIIKNVSGYQGHGIFVFDDEGAEGVQIFNNIIYNFNRDTSQGIGFATKNNGYVYSNTIYNSNYGIYQTSLSDVYIKNNLIASTSEPFLGTFYTGSTNNATDINDTPTGASNTLTNQTFSFISTASGTEDFHLDPSDTGAKDLGADLSTDAYLAVIDDIDGQGRVYLTDIGADETAIPIFRSVGPGNTTALDTGASGKLTIAGLTATFETAVPDNVGVGDVIQYDSDGDDAVDALAFVHKRISSTQFQVLTAAGLPATAVAGDEDWSIFRAYTSLASAESGTENTGIDDALENFDTWTGGKDIVSSNEQWNIACYADDTDTTAVTVDSWTTGSSNYIKIYTPVSVSEVGTSQRHSGVWGDGYMRTAYLIIRENYVKIDGLSTKIDDDNRVYFINNFTGDGDISISNNFGWFTYSGGHEYDVYDIYLVDAVTLRIWNNIGINDSITLGTDAYNFNDSSATVYSYNNTGIANNGYAFRRAAGTVYAVNCLGKSENQDDFGGNFTSVVNSISSDATADDWGGSGNKINQSVKFFDAVNSDFHLAADDTSAVDSGTSSVSSLFSDDIDGEPRTQWDIGADEAAVEFVSMVMQSGSGDHYTSLASWESANQTDLTATTTKVFDFSSKTGTVSDISSVTGLTSGATADVVHVSTTTGQVLLENIVGTFISGEQARVDASNYVVLSDAGNSAVSVARIDGAWTSADTNEPIISGWTAGKYNYIKIYSTRAARHLGQWSDDRYRLEVSANTTWVECMQISEDYTYIDGIQAKITNNGYSSNNCIYSIGISLVSNSIVKGVITGNSANGIYFVGSDTDSFVYNNIVYGFDYTGSKCIHVEGFTSDDLIFNNTVYDCYRGYQAVGSVIAANNIAVSTTELGYYGSYWEAGSSNNLSSDGSADDDTDMANSIVNASVQFADAVNYDFHLDISDATARNAGTSTPTGTGQCSVPTDGCMLDIDGNGRGGAWDIGADEAATEFVSTIMETGGDFASLSAWEAEVNTDLVASGTMVFSGTATGALPSGSAVTLYRGGISQNITGVIVSTSSSQILLKSVSGPTANGAVAPLDEWRVDASNLWTVSGTGDSLGAPVIAVAKIDGAWSAADTVAVTIDSWETGPGNYIKIYTTDSARHEGKWNEGKYRLEVDTTNTLSINEPYTQVDGLQIRYSGADTPRTVRIQQVEISINNNIIRNLANSVSYLNSAIWMQYDATTAYKTYISNNIIYDCFAGISNFYANYNQVYAYNNTVYGAAGYAFNHDAGTGSVFVAKNNIAQNSTDGYRGTFAAGSDFNLSNIAGDAPGSNSQNGVTVSFVSTTTEDFHLLQADTSARNKGVNLTSDTDLAITDDIDGEERPWPTAGSFDIGADQYHGTEATMGGAPDSSVDLDSGLVGHWTFNEGKGTAVYDKSGNGNNGTFSGSGDYWTGEGRFGTAGEFNGSDDYVAGSFNDVSGYPFTLSAWSMATVGNNGSFMPAIAIGVDADEYFGIGWNDTTGEPTLVGRNTTFDDLDGAVIGHNKWTHIVGVFTSATSRDLYVNGQLVGSDNSDVAEHANINLFEIGRQVTTSNYGFMKVDETRIYNRVLSQREIAELYNRGMAAAEWHFKNNLNDIGTSCELGSCKNLTAGGSGNSYASGYLEEGTTALALNGAGYATLADDAYFDIASTSDFSFVATIKTDSTSNMTVVSKRGGSLASNGGYLFGLDYGQGDGIPFFEISDGVEEFSIYGNESVADGEWHTIIAVFDEDSAAGNKIYIDGQDKTGGTNGTLSLIDSLVNSIALNIGRTNDNLGLFTGSIDRVAFFPYALTRDDVLRENANGASVQIGQQTKDTTNGINYDPFGGAPPVAWWKLDEMSGTTAKDYASSTLDGTWSGTGNHFKNGKVGMGGNFNGVDDYASTAYSSSLAPDNFTISLWAKADAIGGSTKGIFRSAKGDGYVSGYSVRQNTSGQINFTWGKGSLSSDGYIVTTDTSILNTWRNISASFDGTSMKLYIDGILKGQDDSVDFGYSTSEVGAYFGVSAGVSDFGGQIDDVKIYDYARTPAQIAWDYNRGAPIAHWKFDEASSGSADGATLVDSSGNGNNGTGDDGANNTGLNWGDGKYGNSLNFDGTSDLVSINNEDYLDNLPYFTVCSWIKPQTTFVGWQMIVDKSTDAYAGWNLNLSNTGKFGLSIGDTVENFAYKQAVAGTVVLDTWQFICGAYKGGMTGETSVDLYYNGSKITDYTTVNGGTRVDDSASPINIGNTVSANNYFKGDIDDVRIYNYVLTDDMIKEVYNNGRVRFGE